MAEFFDIEQKRIETYFNKPFCVPHLHFYFYLFSYIRYNRGCEQDEISPRTTFGPRAGL